MHLVPRITAIAACVCGSCLSAHKDAVRYNELVTELQLRGVSVPDGSGVSVTQVEAREDTNRNRSIDSNEGYFPNTSVGELSAVSIDDISAQGLDASGHATTVARNLCGSNTSMAPGIDSVNVYETEDWLNNRGWLNGTPQTETNALQNHSWVAWITSSHSSVRMDFAVGRDGYLPIAGLYNSDFGSQTIPSDIPEIYGSMYNGITVGVSDGTHRTGTTSSADGPGRIKPEIVAPNDYTSFATPYVTAAAALLIDQAGSSTDANDQLTLKAILLAAANKDVSASWDQTSSRPLDEVYGAGQLDVYESYMIQEGGQQGAGSSIGERGWNLSTLGRNASHDYSITIPAGFELRKLSALITWNRTFRFSSLNFPELADLSLSLSGPAISTYTSDSSVDNLEHIWRDSSNPLSAGTYTLRVQANGNGTEYAIAWRSELYQDYSLWSQANFTSATPGELRDADDDPEGDGIPNRLEQAFGGNPEAADADILPASNTVDLSGQRYLEISFRRPEFENGLNYTVQTVTDLNGTWTDASSEVDLVQIAAEDGGYDRYTYRRADPLADHEKAFLRVVVSEAQ